MRPLVLALCVVLAGAQGLAAAQASSDVLAEIDGRPITAAEVDKALGAPFQKLQEQIYNMKRQKLRAMIAERVVAAEAAKRGMSVPQLLDAEVTPRIGVVSEQDVEKFYQTNRKRFENMEEAAAREQARSALQAQRRTSSMELYVQTLQANANVVVYLKEPTFARLDVPVSGGIVRGSPNAPVTIVEFTDFHCPFCKQARPTVEQLLAKFGDSIRYVHYDFPIEQLHPRAPRAHLAARCANDQGKFWPYHDKVFAGPDRSDPAQLKKYADETGLDVASFESCLDAKKFQAVVQEDIETGRDLGVTGTPTFFINGRMLVGALPLAKFVEIVDSELKK